MLNKPWIASVAIFKASTPSDDFWRISVSSSSNVYWWGGLITSAGVGVDLSEFSSMK